MTTVVPFAERERLLRPAFVVRSVRPAVARAIIERYHYAGGAPNAACYIHGLFRRGHEHECLGVVWWLPPIKAAATAAARAYGCDWREVLMLSRSCLVDGAPHNAASFLVGASMRRIRADGRYRVLITFADTYAGHKGTMYRASNWTYLGLTRPAPTYIHRETGRMLSKKAGPRSRTHQQMLTEVGCVVAGYFAKHRFRYDLRAHHGQRAPRMPMQASLFASVAGGAA